MIRVLKPAVATSIQDEGRYGHRSSGHCRSGAMDPGSLRVANAAAGAPLAAAGVEFGPGPFELEASSVGTIAFGGAMREGAPWNEPIPIKPGDRFVLPAARDGVWSYLSLGGGVAAPVVMGSRSTCVAEGIGRWVASGDLLSAAGPEREPEPVPPLPMSGPVRIFGDLDGDWEVSVRADRMGYHLEPVGSASVGGERSAWSEPLLPGFVQILPSGIPIILMAECPTVGGYPVPAVVHSQDLRLVAQTRPGTRLMLRPVPQAGLHFSG